MISRSATTRTVVVLVVSRVGSWPRESWVQFQQPPNSFHENLPYLSFVRCQRTPKKLEVEDQNILINASLTGSYKLSLLGEKFYCFHKLQSNFVGTMVVPYLMKVVKALQRKDATLIIKYCSLLVLFTMCRMWIWYIRVSGILEYYHLKNSNNSSLPMLKILLRLQQ